MKGNVETLKDRFIKKSNEIHKNKYDYSKVEYSNSLRKVCIICPIHGEFYQTPQAHARGNGCPICANIKRGNTFRDSKEDFIAKAVNVHGDKYDYSKIEYKNAQEKVCIICPIHGEFYQTPQLHINGQGCPKCKGRNLTNEEVVSKFKEIHGDKYDYSKVEYTKMHNKVCIICPKHGEFYQEPSKHILGQGCPKCGLEERSKNKKLTNDEFIEKAVEIHGGKYDYSACDYKGTYDYVTIICPKHGEFTQRANDHLNGHGCPHCGQVQSKMEDEICSFLSDIDVNFDRHNRDVLNGSEIDILIPSSNLGIECDGLKWHSEEFKERTYHLEKTNKCLEKGIKLIHIFEDEWILKKDIVKDKILSYLGKLPNKIYARKCSIGIPTLTEKRDFIDSTHIQGDVPDSIRIGLYHQGELVALMTFGKLRLPLGFKERNDNHYELLRYCTKLNTNVVGGASKLFKYFIENYNPSEVISYCDRRFSNGNMYNKIGFKLNHISQPNYFYIIGNNRNNRFKFRKSELVKEGYDLSKSEHEIMLNRKIYRIYDCGNLVYLWKKN